MTLTIEELCLRRLGRGLLDLVDGIEASRAAGGEPAAEERARGLLTGALATATYEIEEGLRRIDGGSS